MTLIILNNDRLGGTALGRLHDSLAVGGAGIKNVCFSLVVQVEDGRSNGHAVGRPDTQIKVNGDFYGAASFK